MLPRIDVHPPRDERSCSRGSTFILPRIAAILSRDHRHPPEDQRSSSRGSPRSSPPKNARLRSDWNHRNSYGGAPCAPSSPSLSRGCSLPPARPLPHPLSGSPEPSSAGCRGAARHRRRRPGGCPPARGHQGDLRARGTPVRWHRRRRPRRCRPGARRRPRPARGARARRRDPERLDRDRPLARHSPSRAHRLPRSPG